MADYQNTPVSEEPKTPQEEVSQWHDKISHSRKWRDDICTKRRWRELIQEYKGVWPDLMDGRLDIQILPINLIFAYVKTELPSLYIKDPHIKVNPKNRTTISRAKVLESVINYIWAYKKIKREIKKCITDALIIGHSWFKTGYTGTFGTIEDGLGGTMEAVESEDFFAYHVSWDSIVFDPDALDPPHDCAWIAHSVWLPLEEVKKNPRYKNTDKLSASYTKDYTSMTNPDEINTKNAGKCRLTEVWNIKQHKVFTISDGCQEYIEAPKYWVLEGRGFPFQYLKFNSSNDDAYGISDVAIFEPQVIELIKTRSAALDHLKRGNRQFITTPDNISDDEMAKLTKGITGSIIKAIDPTKLLPVPYLALQTDMYAIEERIKEDMINESGQSPSERGATQKTSTRTKAELVFQRQGAENRRSEKIDSVEDFVEEIAGYLIGLVKQFATDPYYIGILGAQSPDLQQAIQERPSAQNSNAITNRGGFTFTKEDIEGEYDVEVVSGSSTPLSREELTKALLQLLELAPKAGAMPGGPLMGAIAKMLIDTLDMPEIILALENEKKAQDEAKAQQAQQAEEQKQLALASQGASSQIDATNAATKQNKILVEFLRMLGDQKTAQTESQNSMTMDVQQAQNDTAIEVQKMERDQAMDEQKMMHDMGLKEVKTAHEMKLKEFKNKQK